MQNNVEKKMVPVPEGGLLQSEQWARVQHAEGRSLLHFNGFHGVEVRLPIVGTYIYFPRAYDLVRLDHEHLKELGYAWVRVDVKDQKTLTQMRSVGRKIISAPHDMQPRYNLIMDISADENEILSQMKSKTRYNIRLARKKGVDIIVSKEKKYVEAFLDLVDATADRKGVSFHPKEHYEKILHVLPENMVDLYVAVHDEKVIAANLISFCNNTATYLHGATANEHRNLMAPYLLQWQSIKNAKERGCLWYDLGGVFPDTDDRGKKGITRFKRGFAPRQEDFQTLGTHDVILSPVRYKIYTAIQKVKSIIHL